MGADQARDNRGRWASGSVSAHGAGIESLRQRLHALGPVQEEPEVIFSRMSRQAELNAVAKVKSVQRGEAFK